jgi:hypothetical protein
MAVAFRAASTAAYGPFSGGFTVTEPAGTVQDDVMLMLVVQNATAGSAPTPPTGWTSLFSGLTAAGGAAHFYFFIAYIVRGAAAPNLNVNTSATSAYAECNVLTYSGCDTTTPIDASANGAPVNAANPDPPSVTAVSSAAMAVCFGTQWNGSTASWTPPAGYTRRSRNTAGDDSVAADKLLSASGAENPAAWSGGSGTNDCWAATLTLAPAGGAPATDPTRREYVVSGAVGRASSW